MNWFGAAVFLLALAAVGRQHALYRSHLLLEVTSNLQTGYATSPLCCPGPSWSSCNLHTCSCSRHYCCRSTARLSYSSSAQTRLTLSRPGCLMYCHTCFLEWRQRWAAAAAWHNKVQVCFCHGNAHRQTEACQAGLASMLCSDSDTAASVYEKNRFASNGGCS